jgi:GNAT superfamily N-acetyltransferase
VLELRDEPSDGPASRALWEEYMALVAGRLPGFRPSEAIFATPEAFTGPGTAWLVGYERGAAVCCGGLRPLAEDGVGEIKRMFVTAGARRRGVGRTLLGALETRAAANGCSHVRLFTTEVLAEARALYESAGYRVVGTVPDGERLDLWLEKTLAPAPSTGRPHAMEERDPRHESTGIEPDDATPTGAEGGNGAPAPFETPDEDPKPVEETGEDREREARGGDA